MIAVMEFEFTGEIWYWRGPSPWHFVTVPDEHSRAIAAVANEVTYGWGMIPVRARIGATTWTTSMFRKNDAYVVPIKVAVQRSEQLELGDVVSLRLEVDD